MKRIYKRGSTAALLIAALLIAGGVTVQAQEDTDMTTVEQLQEQIQQLQEQVAELQERLRAQGADSESVSAPEEAELGNPMAMIGQEMRMGDRSERVRQLQEFLAQDASIYPEGLTTGYFGNLTSQAVTRLQKEIGIQESGEFNSETMSRIRELIESGAGDSGVTPPGLLRAPGIQRLLGGDTATTSDDEIDVDEGSSEADRRSDQQRGPDIERLSVPEEIKERLRAVFNRVGPGNRGGDAGDEKQEDDDATDGDKDEDSDDEEEEDSTDTDQE